MRGHLEEIDVHNSHLLCFERDYLLALSLALIKIKHTRSKAFSIVNSLACKVTDEFELKARISLLNIYLLAHQGLSEEALALEGTLIEKIEKDYSNQEFGINLLNIMYRKCEQLYPTEVAIAKLKQARNYWQGGTPGVLPKYPQEYYRTSNNLIASLIYLNRVQEAEETARELKAGAFYKEYLIQRPEYIENNFLLSCFINKTMTPKECLKAQRKIVESPRAEYDNLISSSNMSIYAAYSNELEISFKLLEACWKRVNEIPDFEVFFRYLIGSNLFTLSQFANRNTQISYEKIQSLTQEVDPEGVGVETYRMPFLQGKANSDTSIHNIEEWDLTPINSHGFLGPSWSFWGRRLMLSGIHSWIDI
ncbi:hypothetical protein L1273_24400 [Pseudoalteromonas sp. DL2-H6]|nr:hypothetical protein [Pseudoalteromonas sp. DL2-H6]MCF2834557.1 hypothetical protein [Pseudoalteromonas sp. DL2-H6]